jgi:hypothetical protein
VIESQRAVMDTTVSKKKRESRFARHFLELRGERQLLSTMKCAETPDFRLREDGSLGLEVVELFRSADEEVEPQALEGGWCQVADQCAISWSKRGLPEVEVWLDFNDAQHVPKRRAREVADKIVALVEHSLPPRGGEILVRSDRQSTASFPQELAAFRVSRLVSYEGSYWHADGPAVWVERLTPDKVQRTLTSKESKVQSYRSRVRDVWLLLVVHGWRESSLMDVPESVTMSRYRSGFDAAFLLDTLGGQAYELRRE